MPIINKQVIVVVNFPPKKIGPFISECLITGFYNDDDKVVLAIPDQSIPNGTILELISEGHGRKGLWMEVVLISGSNRILGYAHSKWLREIND